MKKLQLKKGRPEFVVPVGPFRGRHYVHGRTYAEDQIPPMELKHFDEVAQVAADKPKAGSKKPATEATT